MTAKHLGQEPTMPFGISNVNGQYQYWTGLTKREEFAKAAMEGIVCAVNSSSDVLDSLKTVAVKHKVSMPEFIAQMAVEQADALLAELAKTQE